MFFININKLFTKFIGSAVMKGIKSALTCHNEGCSKNTKINAEYI